MGHPSDQGHDRPAAAGATGLAALRQHTAARHRHLETLPLARCMLSPTLDRAGYAHALAGWAAAWWPLEQAVAHSPHAADLGELRPDPRHALAMADLRWLGLAPASGRSASGPPPLPQALRDASHGSPESLLGLCYVLRGAALGSQVIAAHLKSTLGLDAGGGAIFFATRNSHQPGWPAWMAAADRRLADAERTARACQGAVAAFDQMIDGFARWPTSAAV